jgi:peptide/nickel transport system substrate-binding protein
MRLLLLALVLTLLGCAGPSGGFQQPTGASRATEGTQATKRIVAAFQGDVIGLNGRLRRTGPSIGLEPLEEMVNPGMAIVDAKGELRPVLAEAVPSIENGLWKVLPDGRMETSWTVKQGMQWHDGTAFTAKDLTFTLGVDQDRDIPIAPPAYAEAFEGVTGIDRTITVTWKRPYVDADRLFTRELGSPLPAHLLATSYGGDKTAFFDAPYWTSDYVGSGPFKLRSFELGSHLVLEANPSYPLGRPKIDEIDLRFIPDSNTLVSAILSGEVALTIGKSLSIEQSIVIRDQWRNGRVDLGPNYWVVIHPQLLNPTPAVVSSLDFRRALLYGLDRQAMVDTLQAGMTSVAHTYLYPNQSQYASIEARVPRYEYDPAKAAQMLEGLGYRKGADGLLRDASGQQLAVELRTTAQYDIQRSAQLAVSDQWQALGLAVEPVMIPVQRQRDAAYRATYPAFELLNGPPSDVVGLASLHGSRTRLPENNFIGSNYPRYMNPEFDALIDQYFATIPKQARIEVLGKIIYHIADQLVEMGLFNSATPIMIGNRLEGVAAPTDVRASQAWNAHAWDQP